ncbi:MAG: endonuclease/exonuclease/phosphatase family protein [Chloroflexota bacterium]
MVQESSTLQSDEQTAPYRPPSLLLGVISSTFRAMTGAYALSVLGSLWLHFFADEDWTLVVFTNSVLHLTMLPALVLLPLCLIFRRWGLAALLTPVVVTWAVWYGPFFLTPDVPSIADDAPTLTVVTFNLLSNGRDYEAALDVIEVIDADIVLLQEVPFRLDELIDARFRETYPYMQFDSAGIPGMGFLSRLPIIIAGDSWSEWMVHQRVVVEWADAPLVVYNVHPITPLSFDGFDRRAADLESIIARALPEANAGAVILAGDFNITERADAYDVITSVYTDAYVDVGTGGIDGLGYTFFLRRIPLARLDYVFTNAALTPVKASVWPERGGSDHAPVVVTLVLSEDSAD